VEPGRVLDENQLALALFDSFPVSPGHSLVVSRRHISGFFDLSAAEVEAVFELLFQIRTRLENEYHPSGFNIGINVGPAAGQTVMHAHVHLVPRFVGDVTEPRGGIRNIIPGKRPYQ